MNTANLPSFDNLLQKTLHCSRYARHVLETDTSLLNWLQENYTTPCDCAEMLALLQQSSPSPSFDRLRTGQASPAENPSPQSSPASGRGGEREKQSQIPGGGSNRVADATDLV